MRTEAEIPAHLLPPFIRRGAYGWLCGRDPDVYIRPPARSIRGAYEIWKSELIGYQALDRIMPCADGPELDAYDRGHADGKLDRRRGFPPKVKPQHVENPRVGPYKRGYVDGWREYMNPDRVAAAPTVASATAEGEVK